MWISKISLSTERENNIRDYFLEQKVDFKYSNNVEDFDDLFWFCQRKKAPCNQNYFKENVVLNRIFLMDNVSDLVDRSEAFANFLTVSGKFGLTFVFVFHTIYRTRQHWQMILAQKKKFNIFPSSVPTSPLIGILSSFCSWYKYTYIPKRDLWINGPYFDILNSSNK